MRFLRRSLTGLFLLSVTLGLIVLAGATVRDAVRDRLADEPGERTARERVYAVNVVPATPDTATPVISTFGEIRSRRTLELRASASGEIIWLSDEFENGARVEEGETLARIDDREAIGVRDTARADLAEAEADVRDAQRALELARADLASAEDQQRLRARALDRQRDLSDRGVGSAAAVETAELAEQASTQAVVSRRQALAQAEARVDTTATALDRRLIALSDAERRLSDTQISAPFSGTLSDVSAVRGGLVSQSERLARLIDPELLEVAFRVSTGQYARLARDDVIGTQVAISLDVEGLDIAATGEIIRESALVEEGRTGRLLFARLESPAGFRPGDFVSVDVIEPPLENVVRLPASAVDSEGTVLVVGEEERLDLARTRVLRRQGNDVLVDAAPIAGLDVVAERTPFLGQGIRVRPLEPGETLTAEAPDLLELDDVRRARLIAFVEESDRMPQDAKARVLAQLQQDKVPARMVERIEARMGG